MQKNLGTGRNRFWYPRLRARTGTVSSAQRWQGLEAVPREVTAMTAEDNSKLNAYGPEPDPTGYLHSLATPSVFPVSWLAS